MPRSLMRTREEIIEMSCKKHDDLRTATAKGDTLLVAILTQQILILAWVGGLVDMSVIDDANVVTVETAERLLGKG